GIVPLGSLGEGNTLQLDEKIDIVRTCVEALDGRVPVMPGISSLSTAGAVELARGAATAGCGALMVLPPYVHNGKMHETVAHFTAIFEATDLPCMLYNNPIAYGTDVTPEIIADLADRHANLQAVKESSGDIRRVTATKARVGDRLAVFAGLDDMPFEAAWAGASGWIAGLVNALPAESVRLFELSVSGQRKEAFELYSWFLPLLRLDTVPEFVQLIKLVQAEVGMGSETVRPPRLPLPEAAREQALKVIRDCLSSRPQI
ncbi:MAG: dihydrodipicolinate synthase family protein, partial [Thermoanaerobaculia bacterium]